MFFSRKVYMLFGAGQDGRRAARANPDTS